MDDLETLRRKLHFRSWHRGTREMDLLLGRFAESWLMNAEPELVQDYARLLEENDVDIYNWLSGREPAPENVLGPAFHALRSFYKF